MDFYITPELEIETQVSVNMNTPKKFTAEKRHALMNARPNEPQVLVLDYKISLMKALTWYAVNAEDKKKSEWGRMYCEQNSIDARNIPDAYFLNTYGALSRLIMVGQPIEESDVNQLLKNLRNLETQFSKVKVKEEKVREPKKDESPKIASTIISEIDAVIDDITTKETGGANITAAEIYKKYPNPKAIVLAKERIQGYLDQFIEAKDSTDAYVKEAYSNISRRQMNHIIKFLTDAVESVKTAAAVAKKDRKPRKKKEIPISKIVARFKYLKEFPELSLKSFEPAKIVGASEVTIYDTARKKLSILRALNGGVLSIKGTYIVDFDPSTSLCVHIRKPEETVKEFVNQTKRNTATALKSVSTKVYEALHKSNDNVVIISVNR